jgi:hypothetical protein
MKRPRPLEIQSADSIRKQITNLKSTIEHLTYNAAMMMMQNEVDKLERVLVQMKQPRGQWRPRTRLNRDRAIF